MEYWDNLGYVGWATFKNPTIVNMNCGILEKILIFPPLKVSIPHSSVQHVFYRSCRHCLDSEWCL